ncbi:MAG TPA: hypothetical protein VH560_18920, partial [Polyangia bacterium]|nr:hypothetical protein [Polyangia bacterium]
MSAQGIRRLTTVIVSATAARMRALAHALGGARCLRAATPGIVPFVFLPFLVPIFRVEINEPLFGDTAVFQYTGWCIRHGMRLYRDVGMADGPFIHYLHAMMQVFAGHSDRGFRIVDLFVQAIGGGLIGFFLAPMVDLPPAGRVVQRAAWGGLGAVTWLAWYLTFDWGTTTERDLYYSLFGGVGVSMLYASATFKRPWAARVAFAGAFVAVSQVFGKPTGAVYVLVGAACLVLDGPARGDEWSRRLKGAAAGGVACVFAMVLLLLVSGSIRDYFLWCVTIPYRGNMFLLRIDPIKLLLDRGWMVFRQMAVVSLVAGPAFVAAGYLPRRALPLAVMPLLFFLGAVAQGRGFFYQAVPVSGATTLLVLIVLAGLWSGLPRWTSQRGALAALALAFTAWHFFDGAQAGPYQWTGNRDLWEHSPHQFATLEQQVGLYIKAHTRPEDYVFAYSDGENAHVVLYYAERRTASTFFHSPWLDPIGMLAHSENKPSPEQRTALEALQT